MLFSRQRRAATEALRQRRESRHWEDAMLLRSLGIALLAIGLAAPASAQQSNMHYYLGMFKYADNAIKAMTENPQDRSTAARKLAEGLGGKLDAIYFYSTSGDWDGIVIFELPDDVTAEALYMTVQSSGNFQKQAVIPVITADQFKLAMEKAKQGKSGYTPPTMTK
jgi:uncharacterized protein with GYD domain